jgi:hypothetical protein
MISASCGVKGDPKMPSSNSTPSILENYEDIKLKEKINENKQK